MTRILLQSFETGLYLDLVGAWTSSPALARDFPNSVKATEFKMHRRLSQAFVVVLPELARETEAATFACITTPRSDTPLRRTASFGALTDAASSTRPSGATGLKSPEPGGTTCPRRTEPSRISATVRRLNRYQELWCQMSPLDR